MCKYLNSCTPSTRKTIFKLIGHSAVSKLGDAKFNSESKKLGKDIDEDECLQPAEVVQYPEVTDGVPGYNRPTGSGYRALRNGSVVFVRTPGNTKIGKVCAPPEVVPAAPVRNEGLTQPGPPVKGWSWTVVQNKHSPTSMLSILAQASTSTTLSNSFASLTVERETVQATSVAYNAKAYVDNTCPVGLEMLRRAHKDANDVFHSATNVCNPYPSVDPPFKEYFEDPFEEDVTEDPFEES